MSRTVRITERFALSGGKVDREAGAILGAVICGLKSENGRDYEWGGRLKGAHTVYEGALTNCDHGKDDTVDRRFGWWRNVSAGADGKPTGDFHMLKSHPMYERVMEAAEKNPALYGFSHVIEAKTSRKDGREIVESIEKVISIDLVATPATTRSLFESRSPAVPTFSLNQFSERFGPKMGPQKWSTLTKLCEDMGDMADMPVMDEPPVEDTEGDLKGALMAALSPMLDEAFESGDANKAVAALKDFIKLHAKHTGKAEPKDEPPAEPKESRQVKPEDVIAECKAAQFAPSFEQGQHLARITDKDTRGVVIQAMKAVQKVSEGETPRSAGRGQVKVTTESANGEPTTESIKSRWKS